MFMLPPSSGRNVDILPQHYTASQPRRPRDKSKWAV